MTTDRDFEQLYATFEPKINRYLHRLLDPEDAVEVTQDVFFRAGKSLCSFNEASKLSTWLYKIATNAAIDKMRSRSYKQRASEITGMTESGFDENARYLDRERCSVEEQIIRREMGECIQRYVSSLPDKYRIVLVLSEMEGLKHSQIAVIVGLSLDTVKIRYHRAKKMLRHLLTENCHFYRTDSNELACESKRCIDK